MDGGARMIESFLELLIGPHWATILMFIMFPISMIFLGIAASMDIAKGFSKKPKK